MGDHGVGELSEWADPQSGLSYRREYSTVDPDEVTEELSGAVTPVGQTVEAWGYTLLSEWADPQSGLSYRREYSTVDPDEVTEELSGAVTPVGQTVEAWGYTLFVKDMVMDENGCGIVRFTLDNPSGLRLDTDLGAPNQIVFDYDDPSALRMIGMWNAHGLDTDLGAPNQIVFDYDDPSALRMIGMWNAHDGFPDYRSFYDSATLTPTHLDGVMYFSPIGDSFERGARNLLDGVRLSLSWDDGMTPRRCA